MLNIGTDEECFAKLSMEVEFSMQGPKALPEKLVLHKAYCQWLYKKIP